MVLNHASDCRQTRNFEFAYSLFSFKIKVIVFEIEFEVNGYDVEKSNK